MTSTRPPDAMVTALLEPDRWESCEASTRNKWGHIAHTCRQPLGHKGPHVDPHNAAVWTDKK